MAAQHLVGVTFEWSSRLHRATIRLPDGTVRSVGRYPTAEQAALAHDSYTRYYHSESAEYASLNFPERHEPIATVRQWKAREGAGPPTRPRGVERKVGVSGAPYWYATCRVNRRKVGVGSYRTEQEAARAVDSYRRELGYPAINYPALPSIDYRAARIARANSFKCP